MSNKTAQVERLQQRFGLYDTDGDGLIQRGDLVAEARRIVEAFGEPEGSPKAQALLHAYPHMWDYMMEQAGLGADQSLTLEQFVDIAGTQMLSRGAAGFSTVLRPSIRAMVDLCDVDGDGQVDPAEFRKWLAAIGNDRVDADKVFRQVDTNGNGQLSVEELVAAVGKYHAGELDAPLLGV
ncbi:EF-hand domain-containing protein [Streptomyces lomondensis]|uniref:Calcium-binding protein n=1 Tax=Streptomyces lomondensis TaxID=68229 RepID=A0ABQ2X620_9ACTN|nr:EF-hand domain-containing protein [Streptomyces lomondensis]MCF0078204.1 EF-hand domain-containing protein [Streptomyces lomondensis]GGX01184.1 calcium-binding protein [Streptomyces lomondensis]